MPQPSAPNKKSQKLFLKRRSDFLKTYKGRIIRKTHLTIYGRVNGLSTFRLGVTAPKTVGSAVVRNKLKRWCREIYRKLDLVEYTKPMDFNIFIGSKKTKKEVFKNVEFKEFQSQLTSGIQSLLNNTR